MNSCIHLPSQKLSDYIYCYIVIDNDYSAVNHKVDMEIYPNGLSGICFTFGDAYRYENDRSVESHFGSGAVAIGLHNCIFRLHPSKIQKHIVVTFKQGFLPKLLKTSMHVLNDQVVDLDCFIKTSDGMIDQLAHAHNTARQIDIIEDWLTDKIRHVDFYNNITGCAVSDIINSAGTIKIEDLCKTYNINKKYIERQFKEHIGVTPKKYAELVRLNTVLNQIVSSYERQWKDISLETGFNDYSHLGKHTSKFTKQSPQMLKRKLHQSYSDGSITNNLLGMLNSLCVTNKIYE